MEKVEKILQQVEKILKEKLEKDFNAHLAKPFGVTIKQKKRTDFNGK